MAIVADAGAGGSGGAATVSGMTLRIPKDETEKKTVDALLAEGQLTDDPRAPKSMENLEAFRERIRVLYDDTGSATADGDGDGSKGSSAPKDGTEEVELHKDKVRCVHRVPTLLEPGHAVCAPFFAR